MREILFRGKRIDNGEWVYGYYCLCNDDDTGDTILCQKERGESAWENSR